MQAKTSGMGVGYPTPIVLADLFVRHIRHWCRGGGGALRDVFSRSASQR